MHVACWLCFSYVVVSIVACAVLVFFAMRAPLLDDDEAELLERRRRWHR